MGWENPHWRMEWLPTPVFWDGEFHGLYSPWGCKELDTTEQLGWPTEHGCLRRHTEHGCLRRHTEHGGEELLHVRGQGQKPGGPHVQGAVARGVTPLQGQGQWPRVPGCDSTGAAKRSYTTSEVRGGSREELPRVQGQGRWPRVPGCDSAGEAKRSYPTS